MRDISAAPAKKCVVCDERMFEGKFVCGHAQIPPELPMQHHALEFRQRGGYTLRYHGLRMLYTDTVGHHSYNVAQILRHIASDLPRERQHLLLEAALDHDVAETVTGDMPAPAKRAIPGMREAFGIYEAKVMEENGLEVVEHQLLEHEKRLLKAADAMDGMRFCIQERMMGNGMVGSTYRAFESYVLALNLDAPQGYELRASAYFRKLRTEWETVNGGK